jgi:hypothetical protein
MANQAISKSIQRNSFAFLGKRKRINKEQIIDGYKCDLLKLPIAKMGFVP